MIYKTNEQDTPTMRSLIKVATQKGLIKETILNKTASCEKQPDYIVSGNLTQDILKLCSGLRSAGLELNADELENKFLNYKQAEAFKETGDDVINQAHPDGSHKVSDVEGDAVVETILEQHLKIVNIINKKPTGKLGSYNSILNAVKKVVAQQVDLNTSIKNMLDSAHSINRIYNNIGFFGKPLVSHAIKSLVEAVELASKEVSEDNFNYILIAAKKAKEEITPGLLGGLSNDDWGDLSPYFDRLIANVNNAKKELNQPSKPAVKDSAVDTVNKKAQELLNTLSGWRFAINSSNKSDKTKGLLLNWITQKEAVINKIKNDFAQLSPEVQNQQVDMALVRLNGIATARDADGSDDSFDGFRKAWIV